MDVEPKIGVVNPPKWMVKIMENPIKMDDLGGPPAHPYFWKHPYSLGDEKRKARGSVTCWGELARLTRLPAKCFQERRAYRI